MSKDEPTRRRYSDEELALILRKATEIQESPGGRSGKGAGHGLTLEEIQSIGGEAGIDAEAISRAAAQLEALDWEERRGLVSVILGGPGRYHLDLEVAGRLPPEEMGRILDLIRRSAEHQGEASEVLGAVEWKTVGQVSAISVSIAPRGDATSIRIVGDRAAAGALAFTVPMAGATVLIGALGAALEPTSAAGIVSLLGGGLGSGLLVARALWTTGSRRFRKRLTSLMDTLSCAVEDASLAPAQSEVESGQPDRE